ncbi:tail fiber protein [Serratia phage Pila]|uniref:Tail fiber protein n=1 Tax=Serratia phage Pila TaxID=2650875 RepID=A0A5J6TAU5_9CAUD|nr:tail fiber protein [Serratia phage Pila]
MANVIKTVLTYPLDGSTRDFNIPFEYLARKFVVVTLIGVDRKVLTINTDYRFATRTTISLTKAWGTADGYTIIELRRVTSTTDRLVDFTDGSILRAYDLNVAQIQTMHVAEEARDLTADTIGVNNDGHLDARGRRIVNLANAVDDRDAVPFGQLKTMNQNSWQARNEALQFRNEAETFRNQAEGFKNESSTNASNTNQWRNEAKGFRDEAEQFKNTATQQATAASGSATAAHQSEVNAANSAKESANSATSAEQQADRAKSEADKLGNWNDLAGAIDKVVGVDVYFKGALFSRQGIQVWSSTIQGDLYRSGLWRDTAGNLFYDFVLERGTGTGRAFSTLVYEASGNNYTKFDSRTYHVRDIQTGWSGDRSHAGQWNENAPLWGTVPDGVRNEYFPLIKQRSYQSGVDAKAWHQGILVQGDGKNVWNIMFTDEGGNVRVWTFDGDGSFWSPMDINASRQVISGSFRTHGGGTLTGDGRVYGPVYDGGYLDDWVRRHFIGDAYLGPQTWQQYAGGYHDNIAPSGHVQTGVAISNGGVAGIFVRPVWLSFHNGTKRIIASQ